MVMQFFSWWLQQLRDLLSAFLGSRRYARAEVVRVTPTGVSLFARQRGTEAPLGKLDAAAARRYHRAARREPTILSLGADALLEQSATVPLAAERDLATVLRYEMDRFTPFRAEDLFWSWQVTRRDRVGGQLTLRLLLVPKTRVQAALATIADAGLRPVALEVATSAGLEYLPLSGPGTAAASRRSLGAAAWVCAGLLLAMGIIPVWRQEWAIAKADATIEALRPRVALVDGLRRRISANSSGADLFSAEIARIGNPLRALAAMTAALSDDTYLTAFAMHDRKMAIAGRSAGAARLIGALSNDPELRDPAFDAPITRAGDHFDLFSIQVSLAP